MRNQEAARYARWAAVAAVAIALSVVGVYARREIRIARARRLARPTLPSVVQQQSADFSYSDSDAHGRTTFTIRASHFTQFKDQDRVLLQDVWITVYGREGNRNDNIHTKECSYQPQTGDIQCGGDVQIDVEGMAPASARSGDNTLHVRTSNVTFNKNTGEASTPAPVEFDFAGGHGHGMGATYSSKDSTVLVEKGIDFEMAASDRTGGLPVTATGSSLTIRRDDRIVILDGPADVKQGARELAAGKISIGLDDKYHAQTFLIEGRPSIRAIEGKGKFAVTAAKFDGSLSEAGWIQKIVADGNVAGTRQTAVETDRFQAAHTEFAMLPEHNLLKDMIATGGVTSESQQGKDSRVMKTEALHVTFAANLSGVHSGNSTEKQRIDTVESLAPATVESNSGDEVTNLRAQRIVAQFDASGRLAKLLGHSDVEVRRQTGKEAPQTSTASELAATFGKDGQWDTLDESGSVRFAQADRRASAAHANISKATDTIALDGSPEFSDSISRTTAGRVTINQKSNEIHATGGVVSTYLETPQSGQKGAQPSGALNFGTGSAHISAESVSGSSVSGDIVYSGHARLWQGDSVLEADQIEIWRDDRKLQATGNVVAAFPQSTGIIDTSQTSFGKPARPPTKGPPGPTLWTVRAPTLIYWDDQGKAHLEGGVAATSEQGTLTSRTLDVFLSAPAKSAPASASSPAKASSVGPGLDSGRQLNRILAQGDVVVRQGDRRGVAEQAEYTAADEKFVLSGGDPTLIDNASSDTTTGRSLTFFVANDTILIDSQQGSRTLTKHRVEK